MNKKEGRAIKIALSLIILLALVHGVSHVIVFKTGISLTKTTGLSGLVIGDTSSEEIEIKIRQNESLPLPSMIIMIAEWVLVFSLLALSSIRKHLAESIQRATHIELSKKRNKSDTEIDVLYDMLKKNKKITLTKLAELFKVNKKVVEEWGKILEESGFVVVDYPRFGEIEIRLKDEETHQE
ncbi:MAG: hypothetical protein AABW89_00725 [Nanoarchaeota archaeon]